MPDHRRTPSNLVVFLVALPVFVLVYATSFGARLWAALRPAVATFLGATVIGSVYAEEAVRRAPATPMRAGATLALAIMLVVPSVAPAPIRAADPAEAVIAAAREYLGRDYRLGAEGPREFDCSGLIFRVFSDAGELPRIGGMRLRAAGYMRWFTSRGLYSREASQAERGDLIVWNNGEHIGIYVGDGKAISALRNPLGVRVHSLGGIHMRVTQVLHVNWRAGDGNGGPDRPGNNPPDPDPEPNRGDGSPADNNGNQTSAGNGNSNNGNNGNGNNGNGNNGNNPDRDNEGPDGNTGPNAGNEGVRPGIDGMATGTMNLRQSADPSARIIGWIGRGGQFKIIDRANSPAGYLWYKVRTRNGKEGWLYSRWVQQI